MQRVFKGIAVVGLIAAALALPAQAQQRITVGVGGGVTIPSGSTSDVVKTGWNVLGAVQFKPAGSPLGFQIDGNYRQLKATDSLRALGADKKQIADGTANIVYWFPVAGETRVRPYVLAGGGIYNLKDKFLNGTSTSQTKFGINGGAGFDFDFQRSVGLFVEGRFHNVFVTGSDVHYIPISAGVRLSTR